MNQYMISRNNEPFVITHFLTDRKDEVMVKSTQILGPIHNIESNVKDYIFELGEIDGIFVVAKHHAIILTQEEIELYGL